MNPFDYRDRIFIGETLGQPLYLRLCDFFRHIWLRGQSRSGKTVWLTSIIYQLIKIAARKKHLSIIQIDPKGDKASLNSAIETCRKYGLKFKFISLSPGDATHVFSLMHQPFFMKMPSIEKAEFLANVMGLRFSSTDYGQSYYSAKSEGRISPGVQTRSENFIELLKKIQAANPTKRGEVEHADLLVEKLSQQRIFNVADAELLSDMVNINSVFETPQFVYVYCNAKRNRDVAYPLARMILEGTLLAAEEYDEDERNNLIIFMDEAAKVASPSTDAYLDLAASLRCGLVLAHQFTSQLVSSTHDYSGSFFGGCNTRIDWTPAINQEEYQRFGPTKKGINRSWSETSGDSESINNDGKESFSVNRSFSFGGSEFEKPFFDHDQIKEITADKHQCIIDTHQKTDEGWGGFPMIMDTFYHIEEELHNKRNKTGIRDYIWDKGQIINPFHEEHPESPHKPTKSHEGNGFSSPEPNKSTANQSCDEQPIAEPVSFSATWQVWSEKAKEVHQGVYPTK